MNKIILISLVLIGCSRGPRGHVGNPGLPGSNGVGCSVQTVSPSEEVPNGGALVTCGETSSLLVNGTNGETGPQGLQGENGETSAYGISGILNPCGENFTHDEILLKLNNGLVIALYDGGPQLDRLTVLVPNLNYRTTDQNGNNGCNFSVDENGNLN